MDQYAGRRLGNYDLLELIGKGGMAAVYRAHQPSMNRSVAIKIMAKTLTTDESFVTRFKNEAYLIAQLEHAHILPVYDFGEEEGLLYIVMRYLPAGTLEDRIGERGMPIREALALFKQLASALDYAHQRGVIHRDLKPTNVLVDAQGNAFLTDFGIAKSLEDQTRLTGTGGVVGTPIYMSPEQGLGDPLDARSDIYALGVILYEMLAGQPPFTADNPMAVMLKHINDAPPPPSEFNPDIPKAVEAVVMRALAKDPAERYETAQQMADAFEEAVLTGSVPALAAGFTSPAATLSLGEGARLTQAAVGAPGTTAAPQATGPAIAAPLVPAAPAVPPVPFEANALSSWLAKNEWLGQWAQAGLLSLATFILLDRLTIASATELALLALVPGLLYGLLHAPTLGALISYALILVPLAARTPGLAVIWGLLTIIAGARLNSREIMLTLVTLVAAGHPLGWVVPLLAPWWIKLRRVTLPMALGVTFAILFALLLGWPDAGGLLPVPTHVSREALAATRLGEFDTSFLGLLEPGAWAALRGDPGRAVGALRATLDALSVAFGQTGGLLLILATLWSLASVLSVSHRRSEELFLRAMGPALGLVMLVIAHLLIARAPGIAAPGGRAILVGLAGAPIAFLLSQWPIQADPNAGNLPGTVLRQLRQSMGAVFMALGVAYFMRLLIDSPLYPALWIGGVVGTLTMVANPAIGAALVFAALVATFVPPSPGMAVLMGIMFAGYLVVNLLFDQRRPRHWNPLGAGFIIGAPGMSVAGLLPLGPLSLGALEAQVPAALMAVMGQIVLIGTARGASPVAILIQVFTTLIGVLTIERLMASGLLTGLDHKLRRLLFTVPLAALMAVSYFAVGRVDTSAGTTAPLGVGIVVSAVAAGALVFGMGERARFWRLFIEREEAEEGMAEDADLTTGEVGKART